ncbi:protein of unknown function [Kyrpidia spormannii]|uniref:Uncharacterized protein n=1 Tax=Kyrpidia spormannii TaxID=2055160 RepID=A0A6F9E219_9BACL|nr:protein of unknown function [Kyrpidia spormannii]
MLIPEQRHPHPFALEAESTRLWIQPPGTVWVTCAACQGGKDGLDRLILAVVARPVNPQDAVHWAGGVSQTYKVALVLPKGESSPFCDDVPRGVHLKPAIEALFAYMQPEHFPTMQTVAAPVDVSAPTVLLLVVKQGNAPNLHDNSPSTTHRIM